MIHPTKGRIIDTDHHPDLLRSWNLLIARLNNGIAMSNDHSHTPNGQIITPKSDTTRPIMTTTERLPIIYCQRVILCCGFRKNAILSTLTSIDQIGLTISFTSHTNSSPPTFSERFST